MKKKTTFRVGLIVSAFVLLTLPSMINANSPGRATNQAVIDDCFGNYLGCLGTKSDDECFQDFLDCIFAR